MGWMKRGLGVDLLEELLARHRRREHAEGAADRGLVPLLRRGGAAVGDGDHVEALHRAALLGELEVVGGAMHLAVVEVARVLRRAAADDDARLLVRLEPVEHRVEHGAAGVVEEEVDALGRQAAELRADAPFQLADLCDEPPAAPSVGAPPSRNDTSPTKAPMPMATTS